MRRFLLVGVVVLLVLTVACKRHSRELARANQDTNNLTIDDAVEKEIEDSNSKEPKFSKGGNNGSVVVAGLVRGPDAPLDGKALFEKNCGACHQANGQGLPGAFPPLDGSKAVTSDNVERLASIMLYGLQGKVKVKGIEYASVMAPLGAVVKDNELAAIATYIRSGWSNKAGAVEATIFKAMRDKYKTRSMFTIEELGGYDGGADSF